MTRPRRITVALTIWAGLVLDETWPKRTFTPLMGAGILLGVGVFLTRLQADKAQEPAPV